MSKFLGIILVLFVSCALYVSFRSEPEHVQPKIEDAATKAAQETAAMLPLESHVAGEIPIDGTGGHGADENSSEGRAAAGSAGAVHSPTSETAETEARPSSLIRETVSRMRRTEAGVVVSLHRVMENQSQESGDDVAFVNEVLTAMQDGVSNGAIDGSAMSALKTLNCTKALCELIFDYAAVHDPGAVKRGLSAALRAKNIPLEMISDGPHPSREDELYVFLIRPAFAEYVLNPAHAD